MAITLPVYINTERQDVGDPGGTGEFPGTPIAILVNGDTQVATSGIPRGLLVGVRATCSADAGTVTIRVYSDVSKTDELYNVGLDLSASPFKSSDTLAQGIPFFAAPYFTMQCSTDPNATVFITFYVKAMAGNS